MHCQLIIKQTLSQLSTIIFFFSILCSTPDGRIGLSNRSEPPLFILLKDSLSNPLVSMFVSKLWAFPINILRFNKLYLNKFIISVLIKINKVYHWEMFFNQFDSYYYSRPISYRSYYPKTRAPILAFNDPESQEVKNFLRQNNFEV